MHVAIITAGGAGMFCGSCMHDNTWARALLDAGVEVTLIPTYTPIRVDEENLSNQRVFFGGINVYLEHRWRFWQRMPRWATRWL
ncbi:MAG: hexosyltransferase, partial [Planctomycetaceae bacterium]